MSPIRDLDRLLQDMDINRLRAVVFRDIVSYTENTSTNVLAKHNVHETPEITQMIRHTQVV